MSETKNTLNTIGRFFLLLFVLAVVIAAAVILVKMHGALILAILGIGVIVFFHELGHFTVAKLMDINVQAFSIGFPPVLATIKRTAEGFLVKILPGAPKEEGQEPTALLSFRIGRKYKPGETEYRLGMIPFGGFVKMLGQDDTKVEKSDDPRAYSNKRVGARMAVIVAGVLFNALFAAVIFMVVFLKGINLTPPVVGEVLVNSPADRAGLEPGDEFIEINGRRTNLQFGSIIEAAGLSGKDEPIPVTVKKRDGSVAELEMVAEKLPTEQLKGFGVGIPSSLTVAKLTNAASEEFFERTNLKGGDKIVSVNGKDVNDYFDLIDELKYTYKPKITILARRESQDDDNNQLIESEINLQYNPGGTDVNSESELAHIYSMIPPIKVVGVSPEIKYQSEGKLQTGDVITAIGDVKWPTYVEMREVTTSNIDKNLNVEVLRTDSNGLDKTHTIQVIPQKSDDRVVIGIGVGLDLERPIVAKTVENDNMPNKPDIEKGSTIISVNGEKVDSFFDVIEKLRNTPGQYAQVKWQNQNGKNLSAKIQTGEFDKMVSVQCLMQEFIPFVPLERVYKAKSPLSAIGMGFYEMTGYVKQAFLTLRRFAGGQVNPKNFFGPVGIVKISYDIVRNKSLLYYIYILGLFNAFIAVINSVPLLPFDGGHIVLLAIEKIKGSPVNERIQAGMVYAGLVLVLAFAVYVTFNDIMRIIKPPF